MSNYLETLVEKMVADGVSEKDIKSVIEEVNSKKSPLHQDISGTPGTSVVESPTIGVSGGAVSEKSTIQPTHTNKIIITTCSIKERKILVVIKTSHIRLTLKPERVSKCFTTCWSTLSSS